MFKKINFKIIVIILASLLITACGALPSNKQNINTKKFFQTQTKPGVQLWADNCSRCHNMRPPDSYSDAQWDVAVLHMRIRANLTAADARAIVDYLKSANN